MVTWQRLIKAEGVKDHIFLMGTDEGCLQVPARMHDPRMWEESTNGLGSNLLASQKKVLFRRREQVPSRQAFQEVMSVQPASSQLSVSLRDFLRWFCDFLVQRLLSAGIYSHSRRHYPFPGSCKGG